MERFAWIGLLFDEVRHLVQGKQNSSPQKAPIPTCDATDTRFHHVCIDLVCQLSPSGTDILAFQQNWVARFGAPKSEKTDRGSQFESTPFLNCANFLVASASEQLHISQSPKER